MKYMNKIHRTNEFYVFLDLMFRAVLMVLYVRHIIPWWLLACLNIILFYTIGKLSKAFITSHFDKFYKTAFAHIAIIIVGILYAPILLRPGKVLFYIVYLVVFVYYLFHIWGISEEEKSIQKAPLSSLVGFSPRGILMDVLLRVLLLYLYKEHLITMFGLILMNAFVLVSSLLLTSRYGIKLKEINIWQRCIVVTFSLVLGVCIYSATNNWNSVWRYITDGILFIVYLIYLFLIAELGGRYKRLKGSSMMRENYFETKQIML